MKKYLFTLFFILLVLRYTGMATTLPGEGDQLVNSNQLLKSTRQVSFEENKGQIKDQNWKPRPDVLFSGSSENIDFHIRKDGISLQMMKIHSRKTLKDSINLSAISGKQVMIPDTIDIYRVDMNLIGSNKNCLIEKGSSVEGYNNYYNVPEGVEPALTVRSYESLRFKNIWDGVDLYYHAKNGYIESEWLLESAEDYKKISFEIKGAEVTVDKGQLIMKTPNGEIREGDLLVYQEDRQIESAWVLTSLPGRVMVKFQITGYDPSKPLRIDPPFRLWGTYYGGFAMGTETIRGSSIDDSGNIYLAGLTPSTGMATTGAHQTVMGGEHDAFLVKFNSSGVRQWGTYYGGQNLDYGESCSVNNNISVYLAGYTNSTNNIGSNWSYQQSNGGGYDAFLVKFDIAGYRQWGTYYGGVSEDKGYSCSTDSDGNVYLSGVTGSTDVIATTGAHQTNYGGARDAFLVKFNTDGVREWGTYYGAAGEDYGYSCSSKGNSYIYIAGYTTSSNNIATTGAHQITYGGSHDAFLVKFDNTGVRIWGTYYGGTGEDEGKCCTTDDNGNVLMAGNTKSPNNIATEGSHQNSYSDDYDAFLVKFDNSGVRSWGTYYGGTALDKGLSCSSNNRGNIYLTGFTRSTNNIASSGAYQSDYEGNSDAFLVEFDSVGVRGWGTYYGWNGIDVGNSCATYGCSDVYMAGSASSDLFMATPGAHQYHMNGNGDALLVKFAAHTSSIAPGEVIASPDLIFPGQSSTLSALGGMLGTGANWYWYSGSCGGAFIAIGSSVTVSPVSTTTYYVRAEGSCDSTACGSVTVTVIPVLVTNPNGGENWQSGSTQDITWNSIGITNVKIEYTVNNGNTWETIISSFPTEAGAYAWAVPNTPSSQCKIRISDSGNPSIFAVSDNTFIISAGTQSVVVISPNGEETWQPWSTQNITWSSSGISNVKIEYTVNNENTWTTIETSYAAGDGNYSWPIPNTPSTQCKVRITDNGNASLYDVSDNTFTIGTGGQSTPEICIVSVDRTINKNKVVWDKPYSTTIDHYNIYREGSQANIYELIGSVPYNNLSVFTDFTSSPIQQGNRYKISLVDIYNNETALSNSRTTIHLDMEQGYGNTFNLTWNNYEGYAYPFFNLYRGTNPQNMPLFATLSSTVNSFTDLYPPGGYVYYSIEVVKPNPCSTTGINSSMSNLASNDPNVSADSPLASNSLIHIYPNPTTGILNIESAKQMDRLIIYNILGEPLRDICCGKTRISVDLSGEPEGVYILSVICNKSVWSGKVVIH